MIDGHLRAIADEFGLGAIQDAAHLAGGSAEVTRVRTERGEYVVKRPWRVEDVELYATVERQLNAYGIRQAHQLTTTGSVVASTGHAVQELLPGRIVEHPTARQTANVLRHLAPYDRALAAIDVPDWLRERDTIWTRVTRVDYLREELPALLKAHDLDPAPLAPLFATVAEPAGPSQLVHGDLGPDNVLMDGDEVVAIIDFTPFHDTVLLGLASAVYFFQLHDVERGRSEIESSWTTYGVDPNAGWSALCREALRRLATPLATGGSEQALGRRWKTAVRLAGGLG